MVKLDRINNFHIQTIKLNNITTFEYYAIKYPLFFSLHLTEDVLSAEINIESIYNYFFNYSNINVECYLTNKESIDNYELTNTFKEKEKVNIETILGNPLTIINIDKKGALDYLFITMTEIQKDQEFSYLKLQFTSTYKSKTNNIIPLQNSKYHFHQLIGSRTYLLYTNKVTDPIIRVEYASCSLAQYNYSIIYYNSKEHITEVENYGKHIIEFNITNNESYIEFTLSSNTTEVSRYVIKYSFTTSDSPFMEFKIEKKILYSYDNFNKVITSNWTEIKNVTNYDSTVQAFYYYRLYEKNSSYISKASICSVFQYSYQQLLYVTNIIVSNETFSKKGYENIIIAFLSIITMRSFI